MGQLDLFVIYSQYNTWMNGKLYDVCAEMPDSVRREDRGAFFKSIHGTFNHILLADRIWLGRFIGQPFAFESLDQELYADFDELHREREKTDADIESWLSTLYEEDLGSPLVFVSSMDKREHRFALRHCMLHVFNHQTHHRGQITTLITQLGYDTGVTDLPWLPGLEPMSLRESMEASACSTV